MNDDLSGANWFKSSYSQHGGDCVEVAHLEEAVGVRDSKDVTGAVLMFTPAEWGDFLRKISSAS
ncbi:DUF397 domain-containing protein [Nocardia rhamnosiphila]|uniref:DUF397 domain-containing protein n=1 Tax=Nocardia rhamnosiphila TaxID=426716 RepID=UPI0009DFB218|nr:DUF397 domain-containing protein [Nocardia rhamnosiphila]